MPFTFELSFTGLNVLLIRSGAKPEEPQSVEAVIVNATELSGCHHPHEPILAYRPEQHTSRLRLDDLTLDATGRQFAFRPLHERTLEIDLGEPDTLPADPLVQTPDRLTIRQNTGNLRRVGPFSFRLTEDDNLGFDLVPSLELIGITAADLRSDVHSGPPAENGPVIARVILPQRGELTARNVARDRQRRPITFEFPTVGDPTNLAGIPQPFADFVTLRIGDVQDRVILRGAGPDIRLEPRSFPGPVQASVTNLPPLLDSSVDPPQQLAHFDFFFKLVQNAPPVEDRRRPRARNTLRTANNGFCPVVKLEI